MEKVMGSHGILKSSKSTSPVITDMICSEKQTVYTQGKQGTLTHWACPRTNVSAAFLPQMEAIVFIILKYFCQHVQFWKFGEYHLDIPQF